MELRQDGKDFPLLQGIAAIAQHPHIAGVIIAKNESAV